MLDLSRDQTPADHGGRVAFAVMNTVHWRRSGSPTDDLDSYAALLAVSSSSGLIRSPETLAAAGNDDPDTASTVHLKALELREAAYATFAAQVAGQPLPPPSLGRLQDAIVCVLTELQLDRRAGTATFTWKRPDSLQVPYWLLALSSCALLTNDPESRVRICPGERCGWIFFDETANRSRRWCDGRECGNRARLKSHYARRRGLRTPVDI